MTGRQPNRTRAVVLTSLMVLSVLAVPFGPVGTASAAEGINSCGVIDQPGTYHLTTDVSNDTTCIKITVGDVILDGMGHTVLGLNTSDQSSDEAGILVEGSGTLENVTVRNVTVSGWSVGLTVTSVNDAVVHDVLAEHNSNRGILVRYAENETVKDNTVRFVRNNDSPASTSYGVTFVSDNGTVRNNTIYGISGEGIRVVRDGNTITDNRIKNNNQTGIFVQNSNDNVVSHNTITNSNIREDTGNAGIKVRGDDNLVHNNTIEGSYHRGIESRGINNTYIDITVTNTSGDPDRDESYFWGWDFEVTPHGNATVISLDVGNSTAPNTTLSFVGQNIVLGGNDTTPPENSEATSIGRYFDVNESNNWYSEGYFAFSVQYNDDDVTEVDESALAFWKHNSSGWMKLNESSVDTTNNTVNATITSSGEIWKTDPSARSFGVFASSTEESSSSPNFTVTNSGTNSPVVEGETLAVTVDVENVGGVSGDQNVTLSVDNIERDRQSVALAAGTNDTITLDWQTADGDAGDYTATVASENDTASVAVTVDSTSTGSSSGGSSSGGTGDTTTSTPTPTPTASPTPTPTASPTPAPTATPEPTSSPTASPAATDTATPTASPTPSPTTTETDGQPGFGLVVALLAIALFAGARRWRR